MEATPRLNSDIAEEMGYKAPAEVAEVSLWRAVLIRAIKDAVGADQETRHKAKANQLDAQRWFYEGGKYFELVCIYAGLEPDSVQTAALDFITKPVLDARSLRLKGRHSRARINTNDARAAA